MEYNIIMIGPPCSGKGTHSKRIAEKYGLTHISTGDLFRQEIAKETPLGILAKMLIDKGNLVPDSVTLKMLFHHINSLKNAKGFLLDGVPRTLPQAELFEKFIDKHNIKCDLVFYLHSPDEVLFQRMHKRSTEGRADDNEHAFFKRMMNYFDLTHILTEYYLAKGKLIAISTNAPIEEVSNKIFDCIDRYLRMVNGES
jgi:adenylate kinase